MNPNNLPPYPIYPFVSHDKISLRQILTSDLNDLIAISFYDTIQAKNLGEAIEMNSKIEKDYYDGNSVHWGIVDNQSSKIVGTCGYYRGFKKDEGEIGCVLLPQYRGQGYMTAALLLAIDFGIKNIGLTRIKAVTSKQNEKAIQLLERINFEKINALSDHELEFELVAKNKQLQ